MDADDGIRPPAAFREYSQPQMFAIAFGLAAASLFPPVLLGIFDERMNEEDAVTGLLTGLIFPWRWSC